MKTITLTDEQELFINSLTDKMTTQSNRGTQYPLFYVHEKREVYNEEGNGRPIYIDMDGDFHETEEYTTPDNAVWKLDTERDLWVLDHMENEDDIPEHWSDREIEGDDFVERDGVNLRRGFMEKEVRRVQSVGPFFTEEAAQLHIDQNHYHYTEPFTYVDSAWRNYEMPGVMQLLFALAGKEVPSQYK